MAKPTQLKKLGPVEVIEIQGQKGRPCIVFMHGYGADATDLVSLANVLQVPSGTTWLFPNGTMKIPLGVHMEGRAWFDIDVRALEEAIQAGTHRDLTNATPPGMKKAREQISAMLKAFDVPVSQVVFAGFSQGAMLATSLALYAEVNPKGLVILSGVALDQNVWREKAKNRKGLNFYQSHGMNDPILALEGAKTLNQLLNEGGLKGRLQSFRGGHEIPQEVIHGLNSYLKSVLG